MLEEREPKSRVYSCTKVPSEVYLPDKTSQLVTLYHKEHSNEGKIKRVKTKQSKYKYQANDNYFSDEWILANTKNWTNSYKR